MSLHGRCTGTALKDVIIQKTKQMKKYFTPLLMAASIAVQAQWTTDLSMNTAVRAASGNDAGSMLIADGPEGSTYSCWFEHDGGGYELRMQRLDAAGNRLWPDDGLVVSDHPQNSAIFRYGLTSDADGNALVSFQDQRTGVLDIVAYKLAPDGSFLWGADGVELPTPGTTGLGTTVAGLSNGNSVVAWNTNSSPGHVAFQLVGPTGDLLLTVPTELSAATRLSRPVPVATSDGGFILQYELEGFNFLAPATMYAQRFDAAGTAVWANPIVVSTQTISGFYFPSPVTDGHDGLYVAFNTSNPDNASFTDVYVQRVRGNGSLWSATGTRMDNSSITQKFTAGKGLGWVSDGNGVMVPLQVTDGAQGQSGCSVQRVDTAGVRQLGDAAVAVIPVTAAYVAPEDISATVDGAVIVHEQGAFGQVHIAATRVDLSGLPVWTPAQMDLSTANSNKDDGQTTSMRSGQVVTVWQDDRALSGVYAQNITGLDITSGIGPVPMASNSVRMEMNPADTPVLLLDPEFGPEVTVAVFDLQGKRVFGATFASAPRLVLPLQGSLPGLYTIRVEGKDRTVAVRWMK